MPYVGLSYNKGKASLPDMRQTVYKNSKSVIWVEIDL